MFQIKETEKVTLCIQVPESMNQKLRAIAKENKITLSEVVRTFINEGLIEYKEVKKA